MKKSDIHVQFINATASTMVNIDIFGKKEDAIANLVHRELYHGNFMRQISLHREAITDKIEAKYIDGMLTITIKKIKKSEITPMNIRID